MDIVDRLRGTGTGSVPVWVELTNEAADEIERLRDAINEAIGLFEFCDMGDNPVCEQLRDCILKTTPVD